MSRSGCTRPSLTDQTAVQLPLRSVATSGLAEPLDPTCPNAVRELHVAPLSTLRAYHARAYDDHTATQVPSPPAERLTSPSVYTSPAASVFSGAGGDHVAPLSTERENRISPSSSIVPPRVSKVCQATTHVPDPSAAKDGPPLRFDVDTTT